MPFAAAEAGVRNADAVVDLAEQLAALGRDADGPVTRPAATADGRSARRRARAVAPRSSATGAARRVGAVAVTIGPADLARRRGRAQSIGRPPRALGAADAVPRRLHDAIVWDLRLPRVLTAAAVGAGLALAGAVMQSLTRNPLADPYLLGLSSGASLGRGRGARRSASALLLPVAAFAGALLALVATLGARPVRRHADPGPHGARRASRSSQLRAAGTSFVIFWTATGDSYREILTWLHGLARRRDVVVGGDRRRSRVLVVGTVLVAAAPRGSTRSRSATPRPRPSASTSTARAGRCMTRRRAAHRRDGRGQRRDRVRRPDPAARRVGSLTGPGAPAAAARRRRWSARSSSSGRTRSPARCSTRASCPSASSPRSSASPVFALPAAPRDGGRHGA